VYESTVLIYGYLKLEYLLNVQNDLMILNPQRTVFLLISKITQTISKQLKIHAFKIAKIHKIFNIHI